MKRLLVLVALAAVPASSAAQTAHPLALVTAETQNRLLAVDTRTGRVVHSVQVPADPQNVEAYAGDAAVVSTKAGVVTRFDPHTLKVRQVVRGFGSPHIAAYAPSGDYLFVTDDARGQVASIGAGSVRKVFVGYGAHHMAFSPTRSVSGSPSASAHARSPSSTRATRRGLG